MQADGTNAVFDNPLAAIPAPRIAPGLVRKMAVMTNVMVVSDHSIVNVPGASRTLLALPSDYFAGALVTLADVIYIAGTNVNGSVITKRIQVAVTGGWSIPVDDRLVGFGLASTRFLQDAFQTCGTSVYLVGVATNGSLAVVLYRSGNLNQPADAISFGVAPAGITVVWKSCVVTSGTSNLMLQVSKPILLAGLNGTVTVDGVANSALYNVAMIEQVADGSGFLSVQYASISGVPSTPANVSVGSYLVQFLPSSLIDGWENSLSAPNAVPTNSGCTNDCLKKGCEGDGCDLHQSLFYPWDWQNLTLQQIALIAGIASGIVALIFVIGSVICIIAKKRSKKKGKGFTQNLIRHSVEIIRSGSPPANQNDPERYTSRNSYYSSIISENGPQIIKNDQINSPTPDQNWSSDEVWDHIQLTYEKEVNGIKVDTTSVDRLSIEIDRVLQRLSKISTAMEAQESEKEVQKEVFAESITNKSISSPKPIHIPQSQPEPPSPWFASLPETTQATTEASSSRPYFAPSPKPNELFCQEATPTRPAPQRNTLHRRRKSATSTSSTGSSDSDTPPPPTTNNLASNSTRSRQGPKRDIKNLKHGVVVAKETVGAKERPPIHPSTRRHPSSTRSKMATSTTTATASRSAQSQIHASASLHIGYPSNLSRASSSSSSSFMYPMGAPMIGGFVSPSAYGFGRPMYYNDVTAPYYLGALQSPRLHRGSSLRVRDSRVRGKSGGSDDDKERGEKKKKSKRSASSG
ncbi:hypothetical protein HK096_005758 [Nowakowskiella sp. JEL0078]|nr:hypothetical protein HK096_005758 [Nowakowskiella sp. JEL0078]